VFHGKLYGTTYFGGTGLCYNPHQGCGTVFSLDPATGIEKVLYSFPACQECKEGQFPEAGLKLLGGKLYGSTTLGDNNYQDGTVFSFDPVKGTERVLYDFGENGPPDGYLPVASLISVNRTLYGTNEDTVFSIDPRTGAETVLYAHARAFQSESIGSGLFDKLTYVDGTLYGTATYGGAYWMGTVFSVNAVTGAGAIVYSFTGGSDGGEPNAGLRRIGRKLYGTAQANAQVNGCGSGVVFSIDLATGAESTVYCGDVATAHALTDAGDTLYGATYAGGNQGCDSGDGCGTVFSITKDGVEKTIYSFCARKNCSDGAEPWAGLTLMGGVLYGTTTRP
jgi:uncharacterized repeat protein (TIGR03803 family)